MSDRLRRFALARHGQTDWNREGRYQGLTDAPLNDTGRAQARALAERLRAAPPEAIYTSPLVRASETASIVADTLRLTPVAHDGLRERDVGAWGGLTPDEIRRAFPDEWARAQAGEDLPLGGGETKSAVRERMAAALDEIGASHPGGNVLVVSHGLALRLLVASLLGLDVRHADRLATGTNCSVTTFEVRHGVPRLVTYSDASHLDGAEAPAVRSAR